MFSAAASMIRARPATTGGDWSWKPQPTAAPPLRTATRSPPRARNVTRTPAKKARPCARADRSSPPWPASDAAFSDSTGNTQGMRFRIRPPRKAKARASGKVNPPPAGAAFTGAPNPAAPGGGDPAGAAIS